MLRIVIGLALENRAAATLRELEGAKVAGLREAAVMDRLLKIARGRSRASARLEAILSRELRGECAHYEGCSLSRLAEIWARDGYGLRGRSLAALLWTVTRNGHCLYRKLETRLAEDIEVRAIRSLAGTVPVLRQARELGSLGGLRNG